MATRFGISFPITVAFDAGGNYYVNANGAGSVLKVSTSGIVTTVGGGNGTSPIADGAPATSGVFINLSGLVDAKAFASIGSVAAVNTTGTNNYSYIDPSIPPGAWYYRLKMQDVDGKYTYSPVVSITAGILAQGLVLYPNPVKDRLFVQVQATQPEKSVLRLMDMAGKVLQQQNVEVSAGINAFTFNTDGLARGTYLIICSGSKVQISQFVKP